MSQAFRPMSCRLKNYDDFCCPSRVYSIVWQRCWQAIWTDPPGQYRSSFYIAAIWLYIYCVHDRIFCSLCSEFVNSFARCQQLFDTELIYVDSNFFLYPAFLFLFQFCTKCNHLICSLYRSDYIWRISSKSVLTVFFWRERNIFYVEPKTRRMEDVIDRRKRNECSTA